MGSILLAAVLVGWLPTPVAAGDYYVNTTEDLSSGDCNGTGTCSLRLAIKSANANPGVDAVHVPAGTYTLAIPGRGEDACETGDLDVLEEVAILGAGADLTVIDGAALDRVLHLQHAATSWIYVGSLTIRGGDAGSHHGAGVASYGGNAWIDGAIVEGNVTTGHGGGLYQRQGTLLITGSLIRSNHAEGGSGVATYLAELELQSSAVVGNRATTGSATTGGALWVANGHFFLVNSTLADNDSLTGERAGFFTKASSGRILSCTVADNEGEDVYSEPGDPSAVVLRNSIVRGSCNGVQTSTQGGNLEGPGDTCNLSEPGDSFNLDLPLHPLGVYGGTTPTMPPVMAAGLGHPAVDNDRATLECQPVDQRYMARPFDGNGDGIAVCDSGAVEYRGLIFDDGFESGDIGQWSTAFP